MWVFIGFLIFFAVVVSTFLGMGVGVSFILIYMFPEVSFEIAVLIGVICCFFSAHIILKIVDMAMEREELRLHVPREINGEYDEYEEYEEELDLQKPVYLTPKERNRKKRQRKL